MADLADLPESWTIWSEEPDGRVVLVYRPDVFDGEAYPAACLPTIYLANGPRENRRPRSRMRADDRDTWQVTLTLEPEVAHPDTREFDARPPALDWAVALARRFDDGELDLRDWYQLPRESYLDALEQLVGPES